MNELGRVYESINFRGKIRRTNQSIDYQGGVSNQMPSINDNWVFDFNKHSKNKMVFKLVKENSPKTIEGCMIFSLHNTSGPYLDYLEVAPHNKG